MDKDFQRRGPVLQRDLAAYEGTAARNEQKRLDRQAKLQIADQKDRAVVQKVLLQYAKFLADDPVRKAAELVANRRKTITEAQRHAEVVA